MNLRLEHKLQTQFHIKSPQIMGQLTDQLPLNLYYSIKKCPKIRLTFFGFFPLNHIFFRTIITLKRSVIQMSEKTTDNKLPYTCTSAYDRNACKGCVCSTCYEQEFCDRCSTCENHSKRKEHCNAYEGAYNY